LYFSVPVLYFAVCRGNIAEGICKTAGAILKVAGAKSKTARAKK